MELMERLLESLKSMDCSGFDEERIESILDDRDNDPFDSEWCRVYDEINKLKNSEVYTKDNEKEYLDFSRRAFEIIENGVEKCEELSCYAADDFGLIYDSLVLGFKDEWLDKLTASYMNGNFPHGEL